MAWVNPITWTVSQLVTAANLNEQVRDNMNYLFARNSGRAELTGDFTTTSTSFTDLTGLTVTFTTYGGQVLVGFSGNCSNNGASNNDFTIAVDGVDAGDGTNGITGFSTGTVRFPVSITYITVALSAGSHTIKMRCKTSATTLTVRDGAQFFVKEI